MQIYGHCFNAFSCLVVQVFDLHTNLKVKADYFFKITAPFKKAQITTQNPSYVIHVQKGVTDFKH